MQNPGFLTIAAKLIINVHDMNNEGSIGQTTDIRTIRMVDETGNELGEAPAVSGRMMKHWHMAYMLREELNQASQTKKLCNKCIEWKPDRQSNASDEISGVSSCIICDTHGFLSTAKVQAPPRRSSCVSFSWLLPVIGIDTPSKQVIHSRVEPSGNVQEEVSEPTASGDEPQEGVAEEKVKKKTAQMIFYKNYASSIYAFVCSIDLDRIGKPLIGNVNFNDNGAEIKRRRQMAIKALPPMVMGAFGASQSHALPHTKCLGVLAALSDNTTPIPNLISPIYNDGFQESIKMIQAFDNNKVKYWGYGEADKGEPKIESIQTLFDCILSELK
jgi:CRISPR-associated protein Cst2